MPEIGWAQGGGMSELLCAQQGGYAGIFGWHRVGYSANGVPPLTGSGSAQLSSLRTVTNSALRFTPQMYGTMDQYLHLTEHT